MITSLNARSLSYAQPVGKPTKAHHAPPFHAPAPSAGDLEFADQQRRLKEMRQNPPHQSGRNLKAAESEKFGARTPRMQKEFQELRAYGDNVAMQLQGGWKGPLAPGQHLPKDGLDAMHMIMSKAASLSGNSRDFSLLLKATFAPNNQLGVLPYGVPKSKLMGPDDLQAVALSSTGFHNDWKDTTRGTTSDLDQSHHLTAFVLTGYIYGDSAGAVGSFAHKAEQGRLDNTGDINLGMVGSRYGQRLHECNNSQQLQEWTDQLCKDLRQPATGVVA